ncbi:hypothetical protein GM658_03880 [Pseudoduganella eburnea]|uniref:Uncharacterized protein n=1 Tax=Massilia eburnea TaxID=1776165 RepID=A0A6L6QB92_9BURK|nr:hypothetical protein [Massilia eburnea]MTW09732.1 hypothetical protein [Massilia eburnea]
MHNTDRIQQFMEAGEFAPAYAQGEFPQEYAQQEYAGQQEYGGYQGEYAPTFEAEYLGELVNPMTGEINQEAELAMAAELLSASNQQELDHFLGGLVRNLGRTFRRVAASPLGSMLGNALKGVARAALPTLGGALGSLIPIPGVGTALGAAAGNMAKNALGLEMEGWSNEDREFEVARRIVRIGIEGARAMDGLPEGEFTNQQEIGGILSSIAGKILPSIGNIGSAVLNGLTGQAASGGQASGGLSGGMRVTSPGGWNVQLGGQAGGQASAGSAVGINTPAPRVPFQPSYRPGMTPNLPVPGAAGHQRSGAWRKIGRNVILYNVYSR